MKGDSAHRQDFLPAETINQDTVLRKKRCKFKCDRRSDLSRRIRRQRRPAKVFVVYEQSMEQIFPKSQRKIPRSNRYDRDREFCWEGACVDTGAQKTVIGLRQAQAYCRYKGVKFKPCRNNNFYRFGVNLHKSLGSITIRLPTPHSFISLTVDVVKCDIPFLLGLNIMDKYKMYLNTVENVLCFPEMNWKIPIMRKLVHAYLQWKNSDCTLYTRSELIKLHIGFQHPADDKLLKLFKQARPK